jgi:hypothetical protein
MDSEFKCGLCGSTTYDESEETEVEDIEPLCKCGAYLCVNCQKESLIAFEEKNLNEFQHILEWCLKCRKEVNQTKITKYFK